MEGLGRKEGKTLCLCDQRSWARRRAGRGERERGLSAPCWLRVPTPAV